MVVVYVIGAIIILNFVAALLFYIRDSKEAKLANRTKNVGIMIWLISSITFLLLAVLLIVFIAVMTMAILASM